MELSHQWNISQGKFFLVQEADQKGKYGMIRMNLSGKRVTNSARTVINSGQ